MEVRSPGGDENAGLSHAFHGVSKDPVFFITGSPSSQIPRLRGALPSAEGLGLDNGAVSRGAVDVARGGGGLLVVGSEKVQALATFQSRGAKCGGSGQ